MVQPESRTKQVLKSIKSLQESLDNQIEATRETIVGLLKTEMAEIAKEREYEMLDCRFLWCAAYKHGKSVPDNDLNELYNKYLDLDDKMMGEVWTLEKGWQDG